MQPYLDRIKACEDKITEIQSKLSNISLLETEYNTELQKAYEDLDASITGAENVISKYKPIIGSDALLVEDTMIDLLKKHRKERSQHQEQISQLNSQITTLEDKIEGLEKRVENAKEYLSLISSTLYIIPSLIPDFKPFRKIPERIYQGRDLSGWETVLSDHPWVHPKEEPASIEDVDAIHYGDYSEVRSNVRLRSIYVLNGTFFKIFDDKIFEFIHISGHYFRIPYPTRDLKVKINSEVIGGGFQTFDGPSATGYEIGWGWILNPWNTDYYTRVGFWTWTPEGTKQPWTESKEPDTDWHKIIYIFDKKNDNGYILVDDMVHKVDKIPTKYVPEWRGSARTANLVVEVYNPWPGTPTSEVRDDPELCYRAMGIVQVKDWFWIWLPYNGES